MTTDKTKKTHILMDWRPYSGQKVTRGLTKCGLVYESDMPATSPTLAQHSLLQPSCEGCKPKPKPVTLGEFYATHEIITRLCGFALNDVELIKEGRTEYETGGGRASQMVSLLADAMDSYMYFGSFLPPEDDAKHWCPGLLPPRHEEGAGRNHAPHKEDG